MKERRHFDKLLTMASANPIEDKSNSLLSDLGDLFMDEEKSDVAFDFKNDGETEKRAPAHKIILAASSKVFKAMFYGPLKEEGKEISIVDVSEEAFKEFLQFFYLDKPKLSMTNIAEVMYLGNKYDVVRCIEACKDFLMQSLTIDEICLGYELALRYECKELQVFCESAIRRDTNAILSSSSFLSNERDTVLQFLSFPSYSCNEYGIFNACISWGKENCVREGLDSESFPNLRSQIEPLLHVIRFRSMSSDDLSDIIELYSELFTRKELEEMIRIGSSKFEPSILCGKRRSILFDSERKIIFDDPDYSHLTDYSKLRSLDYIAFFVNKTVWLGEIQFGTIFLREGKGQYVEATEKKDNTINGKVEIIEEASKENKNKRSVAFTSEINVEGMEILKIQPVIHIKPMVRYEIRVTITDTGDRYIPERIFCEDILDNDIQIEYSGSGYLIRALHFNQD